MPATEQTRYPIKRLHRIFAVSSLVLLLATVWMFVDDHCRQWKRFQRTSNRIEARTSAWKKYQFETDEAVEERRTLREELEVAARQSIAPERIDAFRAEVAVEGARLEVSVDFEDFDRQRVRLDAAGQALAAEGTDSDDDAVAMGVSRTAMLDAMRELIVQATFRETRQSTLQKSLRGDFDVAKANVGVALRSGRAESNIDHLQLSVEQLQQQLRVVSAEADARRDHRMRLEKIVAQVTEDERLLARHLVVAVGYLQL